MIIRLIHAKVRPGKQVEFKRTLELLVLPEIQRRKGMIAFYPGQPLGPKSEEFLLVSVWKDQSTSAHNPHGDWTEIIIPQEALPLLEEWHVEGYTSLGPIEQVLTPLFQNI